MRSTTADGSVFSDPEVLSRQRRALLGLLIEDSYYSNHAATIFADADQLADHYLRFGWPNGVDPSTTFQSSRYLDATPFVRENAGNPFLHYLFQIVGEDALERALGGLDQADIVELRSHFDAPWYLDSYPDVARSANDPFVHYLTSGWRELRDPSPSFSTGSYLQLYPDIRKSDMNPFRHWVLNGIAEGRSSGKASSSRLDSWESLSASQKTILTHMFGTRYYQSPFVDAGYDGASALAKYVGSGGSVGGKATPSFNIAKYSEANPQIRDSGQVPFLHYLFTAVGEDVLRELFVAQPPAVVDTIGASFDTAWYLYSYPDVEASGQDALVHYLAVGWREHRDPSSEFSTRIYMLRYPDIVEADINPFVHWVGFGRAEGRSGASSASNFRNRIYTPSITAILINSAENPLTPACVAAVAQQTYTDLEIVIVGAPLDGACRVALEAKPRRDGDVAFDFLPEDSALSPWHLFERGAERACGDLLWFVQGGGIHASQFLSRLTSSFADGSVQLGFGRCLQPEDDDYAISEEELARRMEGWTRHPTTPAAIWFCGQLQSNLLAANRVSFLWRRRELAAEVWRGADDYRNLGLWHLYLHMASGGQIATVRDALVRIPPADETAIARDDILAADASRLVNEVATFWPMPRTELGEPGVGRVKRHILIVTHGIFAGGAENLPIQLANALAERGLIVSLLIFKTDVNPEMRATLNPGVSIYEADWVMEYGCEKFLADIGCSLIHSHGVISEMFFYRVVPDALPVPYVATLHGSYEASSSKELPERFIAKIVRNVDLFVYTADKNLGPLLRHDVRPDQLIKMINAMPVDDAPFPRTRAELGIPADAIVFTLVARGIPEKGWSTAINAFKSVQRRYPDRSMHLCLVGEGEEPERLKPLYADDDTISFLGFQLRIHGLYRMTDVAIVPTRFAGESFPLCIIQALQVAVPVIATDVGEIASMLSVDGVSGGTVVEDSRIDAEFDSRFTETMHSLIDDDRRAAVGAGARILGMRYDMNAFTDQYVAVYEDVIRTFEASPRTPSPHLTTRVTASAA